MKISREGYSLYYFRTKGYEKFAYDQRPLIVLLDNHIMYCDLHVCIVFHDFIIDRHLLLISLRLDISAKFTPD